MTLATLTLGWRLTLYLAAGVGAGVSNGLAGGGTFITFPTMLALGVPALQANVSSSVGVVPSFFGSLRAYRSERQRHRELITYLLGPSLLGTLAGCALLLLGPPTSFRVIVPWLIGAATILFALAPLITRRLAHVEHDHPARRRALLVAIILISFYGGYFGAGLGILLITAMALTLPYPVQELQGLRTFLSLVISATSALVFVLRGHLAMAAVAGIFVGTMIGGWLGTRLLRRLSPTVVRVVVVLSGVITTVRLFAGG